MLKSLLTASIFATLIFANGLSATAQSKQTGFDPVSPTSAVGGDSNTELNADPGVEQAVSAAEVEQFAHAIQQMRLIQDQAYEQATAILDSAGLSIDRFNEILHTQQDASTQPTPAISAAEQQGFEQAFPQINQIRAQTQQQMQQAIEQEGLNMERFNQNFALVQQDSQLREAVQQSFN
ncbi:MAG TPA: DUF4168 domain-containing protein [Allocoleopsis sp.]